MYNVRTDLAIEATELYNNDNKGTLEGVEVANYNEDGIEISEVKVINETGEKAIGKAMGTYITIKMPKHIHYDSETALVVSTVLSKVLQDLIKIEKSMTVLVVGLGNWNVTPDAIGPRVVERLMITRHLKELIPDSIDEGIRPVCAIAPGVLGITGIETGEIIRGVTDKIKPNLIICIDALASRGMERVNSTIQIGNTGISPGSGVGNRRKELSEKNLGVPVLAIGVPTVVDAATIANDTMDLLLDEMIRASTNGGEFYKMLKNINKDEKEKLITEILTPNYSDFIVTPKDIDMNIDSLSKIIANGLNIALQPALDLDDINKYIN